MSKATIKDIPIELIDPPADPLRESIDPEYIRELGESIREMGLLQPIEVRPVNSRFEIIFGHRRYLASRVIGADKVRAIVVEMSDEEVVFARAVENDQRVDLTPLEKARVYGMVREKLGMSPEKIARKMGRAVMTVRKYLALLDLEEEFQKAIDRGTLSMGAALVLQRVDDPAMRRYYLKAAVENGVTEKVALLWVEDYEKTKVGKFYDGAGGGGGAIPGGSAAPIYNTCGACKGPVEVSQVRYVPMCPGCIKEIERG